VAVHAGDVQQMRAIAAQRLGQLVEAGVVQHPHLGHAGRQRAAQAGQLLVQAGLLTQLRGHGVDEHHFQFRPGRQVHGCARHRRPLPLHLALHLQFADDGQGVGPPARAAALLARRGGQHVFPREDAVLPAQRLVPVGHAHHQHGLAAQGPDLRRRDAQARQAFTRLGLMLLAHQGVVHPALAGAQHIGPAHGLLGQGAPAPPFDLGQQVRYAHAAQVRRAGDVDAIQQLVLR